MVNSPSGLTFVLDNDGPLTSFTPSSVSGSFTKDSNYILNESVYSYDGFGRPTRIDDARGERRLQLRRKPETTRS